ncbi:hypothetical protein DB42_BN00260 [Neochlamydia sp. EPS4]|uniref:FliO/MopB family protein n=1 Tax=Neochlamydia sp. EPS4 TaxID=1478175 RepID=UPI000582F950|nr:flagellar biosynthetic protein FliO [Neochlamydia sp. EPS4]KIC73963.1 hypothetical protein DB42_BN00260 [Neochlamydia sp. EPS4]
MQKYIEMLELHLLISNPSDLMKNNFLCFVIVCTACMLCKQGYSEQAFDHPQTLAHFSPALEEDHSDTLEKNQSENFETPIHSAHPTSKVEFSPKIDDNEGARFFHELINMLTTLGLIVAVVLIASWMIKRLLRGKIHQLNATSLIKVIEYRSLTPKTAVYLLEIKGKGIIIAESVNGVTHLGAFENNESEESLPLSFKERIENKDISL